jgi:hypothetical protein
MGFIWCTEEVVMKLANVRSMLVKGVTVGLLAGAVALAAPAKANAEVIVGVGLGAPYYGAPYGRAAYYERLRIEEARRHAAWVRAHEYRPYAYGRGRW